MKKILWLEDEIDVIDAVCDSFQGKCEFAVVNNLFELQRQLYKDPGVETFDLVLLDMSIASPGISIRTYKRKMPQLFEDEQGNYLEASSYANLPMIGFDYYKRIVCVDKKFADIKFNKFMLMTGHYALLERGGLLKDIPVRVIKKRGQGSYEELEKLFG